MKLPWLDPLRQQFQEQRELNRTPHAILLEGPEGSGKQLLAREWRALLLCQASEFPACGACRSCELLVGGAHPDFREITFTERDDSSGAMRTEIVVDQIRALIGAMSMTPSISPRLLALIQPAEAMNQNAANALLKTLEEPAGNAVLILLSHDASRLPFTIRSRCQSFTVRLPDDDSLADWLSHQAKLDSSEARQALMAAAKSPLAALSLIRHGRMEEFHTARQTLAELLSGKISSSAAADRFKDTEAEDLWRWFSVLCAERISASFRETTAATPSGTLRALAGLQQQADRNRSWMGTPLRKDFLLQEWLIQWARLASEG